MQNKRGFSLIELMIVIAIASILAVGVAPAIRSYLDQNGLRAAVNKLRSDLQLVKLEAVKRNFNAIINIDQGFNQYQVTYDDPDTVINPDITWPVENLSSFRGNARITDDPETGNPSAIVISFTSSSVSTTPGAIFLTSDADNDIRPFRLRVTGAGSISENVWDPTTSTWLKP